MEPSDDFRWPDDPEEAWWVTQGTAYGLKIEYIKFAAARFALGGDGSRKNSLAASLAGIEATPSQSFRIARSVGVARLLAEATRIRAGRQPRVTDAEIDQRIDLMIKSPDHRSAGAGIELRARRDALARARDDGPADIGEISRQLLEISGPEGAIGVAELWHTVAAGLMDCPFFTLLAPILSHRYPALWQERYRAPMASRVESSQASKYEQALLIRFDAAAALPLPTNAEFRAAIGKPDKGVAITDTLPRGNGAAPPEQQVDDVEDAHAA
jgi:hypothetical protein